MHERTVMAGGQSSDISAHRKLTKDDIQREEFIRAWIWEYVLKFSSNARVMKALMDALSFPNDAPRLKQMVLLKDLSGQVSKGLDLHKALNTLEGLLELLESGRDRENGTVFGDKERRRKRVKASRGEPGQTGAGRRGDKDQIDGEHVESKHNSLMKLTKEVMDELRQGLADAEAPQEVDGIGKQSEVERRLRDFIDKAWTEIGTVFLQKIEMGVARGVYNPEGEVDISSMNAAGQELERGRRGLLESCAQLRSSVKDPLPAILEKLDGAAQVLPGTYRGEQTVGPSAKRSLLDPHPSAQAHEWNDNERAESPAYNSPSASRRVRLPVVKSPLRMPSVTENGPAMSAPRGQQERRKRIRWSDEEVDVLKREVQKYGKGCWKVILHKNSAVFQKRTEVDLKDKWRNLEKYEGIMRDDCE